MPCKWLWSLAYVSNNLPCANGPLRTLQLFEHADSVLSLPLPLCFLLGSVLLRLSLDGELRYPEISKHCLNGNIQMICLVLQKCQHMPRHKTFWHKLLGCIVILPCSGKNHVHQVLHPVAWHFRVSKSQKEVLLSCVLSVLLGQYSHVPYNNVLVNHKPW
jgi:hypothetical protein